MMGTTDESCNLDLHYHCFAGFDSIESRPGIKSYIDTLFKGYHYGQARKQVAGHMAGAHESMGWW